MSTQLVNALDTYDAAGANREDIHDIVSLITP